MEIFAGLLLELLEASEEAPVKAEIIFAMGRVGAPRFFEILLPKFAAKFDRTADKEIEVAERKSIAELQVLPHLETLVLAPVYGANPETTVTDVGLLSLQKLSKLETLYVGWHRPLSSPSGLYR